MKILIAYDGSECARAAIEDLQRAGMPAAVEAIVLSVADVFMPPPEGEPPLYAEQPPAVVQRAQEEAQQAVKEALAMAQQGCEHLRALFPHWHIHPEARPDHPAWGIIKQADVWQPDLLVIGSRGRSTLSRLLLGSVSHKVLTEVRCSVRIARGQSKAAAVPIRLLLGVDGSSGAQEAVKALAARPWPQGTQVCAVVAIDPTMESVMFPAHPALVPRQQQEETNKLAWATRMLKEVTAPLHHAGLALSTLIEEGEPAALLLATAAQWNADSIWVGARGLGGMARLLLGSVSTTIATRASCSVEVVHAPDDAHQG